MDDVRLVLDSERTRFLVVFVSIPESERLRVRRH